MKNVAIGLLILAIVLAGFLLMGPSDEDFITGGASFCHTGYLGIYCEDDSLFEYFEGGCDPGFESVCTNYCELDKVLTGADIICPLNCEYYCVPVKLTDKLNS